MRWLSFLIALLFPILLTQAEDEASASHPSALTLDLIFKENAYKSESFSARWRTKGPGYTFLKSPEGADGTAIWKYLPGEAEPTIMVRVEELTPTATEKPLALDGYAFSDDESLLLIYTNSKRVWRRHTRGDYWILDRGSGELRQLGGNAPEASLMFAKISPNGQHVAYVMERNLYVEDLASHEITCLTETPTDHIINGTSDWVYEEELGVRDGFRWSPNSESIAFWQFDESDVRHYTLVDHVSGLYPQLKTFGYPKVGQVNASCRIGVVSVNHRNTFWVPIPGDPRNHYLARMEWADNDEELLIQQLNRAQNENRLYLANIISGEVRRLFTERDDCWVDVHDDLIWVDDGKAFTWISERNGWRQLFLVSKESGEQTCLTPVAFDIIRVLMVDRANQWVYFIASPDNPAERYLYRVDLEGNGLERLTPRNQTRGSHAYAISPDGEFAIWTASTFDDPPVTRLVRLPKHDVLKELETNNELREKIDALDPVSSEFFYVDIGASHSLHARCLKPPGFDATKSYPLLVYVYGEPAGQVVTDRWGGRTHLWHWMLAQQGYVILSVDNRGTAAPRGRAFRKASYRKLGILPPEEQAQAVRAVLKERPYLDPERVGVWGWSGGGSMSLNAIFKYPDLYQTAIAVASVPNQRYYDTIYQERYMGLPGDNVDGYRDGSPIHFAHQLEGDLLIVHGAADDNCHYQTFEKLVDQLIQHEKPFTMMTYPRGTHAIKEGKNTTRHLYGLMTRFLHQHLSR